ncbi:MAG: hypothetical protein JXR44_03585, partial [Thiotrichales bacterium]|nr:hypothetical protein [Thiotrichales bacterium]
PPAEQTADLNGTAAVGAPIVGGQVTAKCSDGSGFTTSVTTNTNGTWSGQVGLGALPCALSVNDSNRNIVLKSFTASPGLVNITPLTNLIVARATNQDPTTWFNSNAIEIAETQLTQAANALRTALNGAGFALPEGNPLNVPFVIGDNWDRVLDDLDASIQASAEIESYQALLNGFREGNNFIPSYTAANGGGNTGGDTGGDNGGNTGGDTGGDNGGNTGGDTGGDNGGNTGGDTGGGVDIGNGNYDLTLSINVQGNVTEIVVEDIAKPANQSEFCSVENYQYFQEGQGADVSFQINSCSFNDPVGQINATLNGNANGFPFNINYTVTYTYTLN